MVSSSQFPSIMKEVILNIKDTFWGWRAGSVVKSTGCSIAPSFKLDMVAHNLL